MKLLRWAAPLMFLFTSFAAFASPPVAGVPAAAAAQVHATGLSNAAMRQLRYDSLQHKSGGPYNGRLQTADPQRRAQLDHPLASGHDGTPNVTVAVGRGSDTTKELRAIPSADGTSTPYETPPPSRMHRGRSLRLGLGASEAYSFKAPQTGPTAKLTGRPMGTGGASGRLGGPTQDETGPAKTLPAAPAASGTRARAVAPPV
jgi:hypothetical protein